jgi:DNA-binding transcriptional ArsR family regulator
MRNRIRPCDPSVHRVFQGRSPGAIRVREIVPLFDVSQPTISHHLKILREAGPL